ncbi:hypothetical protein EBB07_26580 [Paenibacillaceae bacterium]|nr:hypothetical protein EBB07_26580 [Paenibacillaceae bacterium]
MNSLRDPHWYDALKKQQPLRKRMFTEEMAAGISKLALEAPARRPFFLQKSHRFGAVMIIAAACAVILLTNLPVSNVVPTVPSNAGVSALTLDPQIRDRLINPRDNKAPQKQILLEKMINGNLALIYSSLPESANSTALYIDILQWKDSGNRSIGTGLDGWSHAFSSLGAEAGGTVMSGVTWEGKLSYTGLNIFTGKLLQSDIAAIRVVDGSGEQWDAHILPSSDGSRYWFVDMSIPVEDFKIEALDAHGTVLSTHSPK